MHSYCRGQAYHTARALGFPNLSRFRTHDKLERDLERFWKGRQDTGSPRYERRDDDYDVTIASRMELPVTVDNHHDDAEFVSHQDWQQRIEEVQLRRKEQQPQVLSEEQHSTGIFGILAAFATGLWRRVKSYWV